MSSRTYIRWAAGMLSACFFSGCAPEARPLPAAPVEASAQAPFDMQKVMEQVHFAFRPEGKSWRGGHGTYEVHAEAGGLSITPYHYPRTSSEERLERRREGLAAAHVEGAPVRLGAARVSRGDVVLSGPEGVGRVEATGALSLVRGEVVELLRNGADGVEQSWRFERRPEGTEALEVRVPVEAGRFLGETAGGLHFADGSSGLGVRYGHGTWVDARGVRTSVPARFERDAIVLRVPAPVVEDSAYPAVLDPIVSPEFGLDTPVTGYADNAQEAPAVAHDGTNYLVVWQDARHGGRTDIYGARVSGAGVVLDPTGLPISKTGDQKYEPAVAHDGTNFLVVWASFGPHPGDIRGTRVSGAGVVLDPGGIPISTAVNAQRKPAVAHDGTNFLVVWQDLRNGVHDVYGARVDGAGTVLDTSGIPLSTAANEQLEPAVAHNGTNFLVVWQDSRSGVFDIYGTRVSGAGTVLNTNGILISVAVNAQERPEVAYNGSDFVVVWEDSRNGNADIYGARVSASGVVRNPSGIPISVNANEQRYPRVARVGTECMVVWHDNQAAYIYGARVSNTGAVLNPSDLPIASHFAFNESLALASDGTNLLVAWGGYYASGGHATEVQATRVSGVGVPLDNPALALSRSGNGQYTPVVAHDGTNFLVVWHDRRNPQGDIYGARVSETGVVLDPSGIRISSSSSNAPTNPAVAHDGTNFLVVWEDYQSGYGIYGARVSSAGSVLDTPAFAISTSSSGQFHPEVAHDGTNFLVVWHDFRQGNGDIYGARVNGTTGSVLDPSGIAISAATDNQMFPKVAHNGTNFLVVWHDTRNNASGDIYGARVSSAGVLLDTSGIAISAGSSAEYNPAVTHNGIHFLVVWEDWRSGPVDIYGARLDSTGAVLDTSGIPISLGSSQALRREHPTAVYDGDTFVVAWQDYRAGTGLSDIYGARVDGSGVLVDTLGFAIAAGPDSESEPVLVSMGGQSSLAVYVSSQFTAGTNAERVQARLVQMP
ncbi:hypothetical protein [Archangium violaceum]|uniref:hypothetical protein n=1 Tax=Archangium violaceum TaxID=83451 RepID=UPI0036D7FB18